MYKLKSPHYTHTSTTPKGLAISRIQLLYKYNYIMSAYIIIIYGMYYMIALIYHAEGLHCIASVFSLELYIL